MKIINREQFLEMPPETLFSKYEPCRFAEMQIKGRTSQFNDFGAQSLHDAVDTKNGDEFVDILTDALENGTSFDMDFDCQGRDGMYDDQSFVIWEQKDIQNLIKRLSKILKRDDSKR